MPKNTWVSYVINIQFSQWICINFQDYIYYKTVSFLWKTETVDLFWIQDLIYYHCLSSTVTAYLLASYCRFVWDLLPQCNGAKQSNRDQKSQDLQLLKDRFTPVLLIGYYSVLKKIYGLGLCLSILFAFLFLVFSEKIFITSFQMEKESIEN